MLHAAAMLIGLFIVALFALSQRPLGEALALAAGLSVACTLYAARFGGISASIFSAPQALALGVARFAAVAEGALKTIRSAIAADVTLKPALVKVKSGARRGLARVVMADLVSSAPGAVVVDVESDGAFVHVTDEDSIDAAELGALEARIVAALERRP